MAYEVEKSYCNQKVSSSIPCRAVMFPDRAALHVLQMGVPVHTGQ